MDSLRIVAFIGLSFLILILWDSWMKARTPLPEERSPEIAQSASTEVPAPAGPAVTPQALKQEIKAGASGEIVRVETDLMVAELDTRGAEVTRLWLKEHFMEGGSQADPYLLMDQSPALYRVTQSGLVSESPSALPDHNSLYQVAAGEYRLEPDSDVLDVVFQWQGPDGTEVQKHYRFHRDRYAVQLEYRIRTGIEANWSGRVYTQFLTGTPRSETNTPFAPVSYAGGATYSQADRFQKLPYEELEADPYKAEFPGGWIAVVDHYFMTAWIPPSGSQTWYYADSLGGGRYRYGAYSEPLTLAPGETAAHETTLYLGPKEQKRLREIAPGLVHSVDYGWLTFLSQPLFQVLAWVNRGLDNWGWSIVVITLLIKVVFFKLSEASYRSMAHMRRLQPKLVSLRERYADDRQKLNQAMMELYKQEKINPLGGCLPMLIQIPVFIALYWVLLESVELRHAPFIFWLQNLTAPDPYYVLPVVMGISMLIQQKLNPAPMEPMQQKIMMALPFVFTVFFAFFPAGLVLYWVVNNILSIAQQWVITRKIEAAASS